MPIQMVRVRIQIVSFSFFLLLIKSIESQIKAFRIICYHSIIIWKNYGQYIFDLRFVWCEEKMGMKATAYITEIMSNRHQV